MELDKIIITGVTGGLGTALSNKVDPEKQIGIVRDYPPEHLHCKYFIKQDLYNYKQASEHLRLTFKKFVNPEDKLAIVLSAGTLGTSGGLETSDLDDWANTIDLNLLGNIAVIQALLPQMIESQFGRIVFVAGGGAANAYPIFSGYSLSKTAIVRAVENIAVELKDKIEDFSIIALAPGAMETQMLQKVRAAGAEVKTTVDISEPVDFIDKFIHTDKLSAQELSGRFIHVRDDYKNVFSYNELLSDKMWKLRRIE